MDDDGPGCGSMPVSFRRLLGFTTRGGGKNFKDVSLAVLERHYRIHMLHHLHKDKVSWEDTMLVGEEGEELEGTSECISNEMHDMKHLVGSLDMEWTRDKRVRTREDAVGESIGGNVGQCIVKRQKRKVSVKGE